jgi:2-polyprenyl-6-methoxyphenol hydroxylase-like FAD-dependent oxidoreductase
MSSAASRIVITGAGIGGLTLALLPRRRGSSAEILEQAPELREVGAAVALAANGTRVLQHLSFDADLVGADGMHSQVRRWVTGGDEPRYSAASGFRGLVPVSRLPGAGCGPGRCGPHHGRHRRCRTSPTVPPSRSATPTWPACRNAWPGFTATTYSPEAPGSSERRQNPARSQGGSR